MNRIMHVAGASMLLAVAASVAHAAWQAPTGGWDYDYSATSGNRPDQMTPSAPRSNYQITQPAGVAYSGVITDSITGEKTLLMNHTGTTGNDRFGGYKLSASPGSGAATDQLTIDFRLRLTDATQPDNIAQFQIYIARPVEGSTTKQQLFLLNFAEDGVYVYGTGGSYTKFATTLGTDWHDFRWLVDAATHTASLYMDNSSTALLTTQIGVQSTGTGNAMQFGDGASAVIGIAELSYLRVSNDGFAAIPEPAAASLLAAGIAGLLLRRRNK